MKIVPTPATGQCTQTSGHYPPIDIRLTVIAEIIDHAPRVAYVLIAETVTVIPLAGLVQRKADQRRAKARKPHRLSCNRLWTWAAEKPGCGWSPPLVPGRLRVLFPDDEGMRVLDYRTPAEASTDKPLNLQDQ